VPIAGWPILGQTQVAEMPVGGYVTLSNRLEGPRFDLYIIVTQFGETLEFNVHRGK